MDLGDISPEFSVGKLRSSLLCEKCGQALPIDGQYFCLIFNSDEDEPQQYWFFEDPVHSECCGSFYGVPKVFVTLSEMAAYLQNIRECMSSITDEEYEKLNPFPIGEMMKVDGEWGIYPRPASQTHTA